MTVLYPLNDFAFVATIKVMGEKGALVALETGTVSAFLATSAAPTAEAADPSLVATVAYTGADGKWTVLFDATLLQPDLLSALFGSTPPVCILTSTGNLRRAIPLTYAASYPLALA